MPTSTEAGLPTAASAGNTSAGAGHTSTPGTTADGHVHWLSWARIVAIVAVVTVHVCAHLTLEWGTVGAKLWHFGNLAESAGRFAVPLFVMVSGATLLPPRPGERLRDYYRRRAARIAIPLVGWTAGYLVLDAWLHGRAITSYTFVQGFAWGRPYYHLYFLYVVAGLYLVTPFLRAFVATADRRLLVAGTAVCLGLATADKAQHLLMGGGGFNAFSYFVPFLGYYLLGYVVATARPRRPRRVVLAWSAGAYAAAVLVTAAVTWWLFGLVGPQNGRPLYDYYAPTVLVASVAMAYGLRAVFGDRAPNPARARLVRRLADLTFGVFLLHPIPLELLVRRHQPAFASDYADMAFHVGVVLALVAGCGLVTLVLRRVPVVRRLF
ncbi:acyltransferase family protein [Actinopolymorpha rutila]|uniref:Surface polysaccharide O-acyltransferase-like enzyme n=1 Tax=Actinopolymorpha rutila TaxID=446787 RepID=A0A852Z662_9ACTN|nr:surface polysaccharide O-acyltransferase-like enzyme [Actinopolymorpha rutila]